MSNILSASNSLGNAGLVNILSNVGILNLNIPQNTLSSGNSSGIIFGPPSPNILGGQQYVAPNIFGSTFQPRYGYGIGSSNSGLNRTLVNPNFKNVKQISCSFEDYSSIDGNSDNSNPYVILLNTSGSLSIWSSGSGLSSVNIFVDGISDIKNIKQVEQSKDATFLVFNDGSVTGWGTSPYICPELTNAAFSSFLTGAAKISISDRHALILFKDGTYDGWGCNDVGQISQAYDDLNYGVQVSDIYAGNDVYNSYLKSGSANNGFSLALSSDGGITGWGYNYSSDSGVSGDWPKNSGLYKYMTRANDYNSLFAALPPIKKLAIGASHIIALFNNGRITGWGNEIFGGEITGAVNSNITGVTDIFAGFGRTAVIYGSKNTLTGWGYLFNTASGNITGNYFKSILGTTGVSAVGMGKSSVVYAQNTVLVSGTTPTGRLITPPLASVVYSNIGAQTVDRSISLTPNSALPVVPSVQTLIPVSGQVVIGSGVYVLPSGQSGSAYNTGIINIQYTGKLNNITGVAGVTGYFSTASGTDGSSLLISLIQQVTANTYNTTVLITGAKASGTNISNINITGTSLYDKTSGTPNSISSSGFSYVSGFSTILTGSVIRSSGYSGILLSARIPVVTIKSGALVSGVTGYLGLISNAPLQVSTGANLLILSGTNNIYVNNINYGITGQLVRIFDSVNNTYSGFRSIVSFGTYGEFNHNPLYTIPSRSNITGAIFNAIPKSGNIVLTSTTAYSQSGISGVIGTGAKQGYAYITNIVYSGDKSNVSIYSDSLGNVYNQSILLPSYNFSLQQTGMSARVTHNPYVLIIPKIACETVYSGFNYDTILFNDTLINGSSRSLDGIMVVTTGSGQAERTVWVSPSSPVAAQGQLTIAFSGLNSGTINGVANKTSRSTYLNEFKSFIGNDKNGRPTVLLGAGSINSNLASFPIVNRDDLGSGVFHLYTNYTALGFASVLGTAIPVGLYGPTKSVQIDYTNPNWIYASGVGGKENYLKSSQAGLRFYARAEYFQNIYYSGVSSDLNGKTILPPIITGDWNGVIPSGTRFKIAVYTTGNTVNPSITDQVNIAIYDAQIGKILNTYNTDAYITGTVSGRQLASRFTNPFLNGKITSDPINVSGIDPVLQPSISHKLSVQNIQDKKRLIVNNITPLFYN